MTGESLTGGVTHSYDTGSTFCHGTVFEPKHCLYQKEATGMESPKMYSSSRCKNLTCLCRTANDPVSSSQYRAKNGNLWKFGSTFFHGTVFAPKQCLYQKEATGMESPKMYSSRRCKDFTYLCRTAHNPVSCKPIESRERKFAEIRVYLLQWYCVCTKPMFISKGSYGIESPKRYSSRRCKNLTYLCRTANYPVS